MTRIKFICFFIILAILIAGAFLQHTYLTGLMTELSGLCDNIERSAFSGNFEEAADHTGRLDSRFEEETHMLSSLLDHSYICDVNEQIGFLNAALAAEAHEEVLSCCAALKHALSCISELELINVENIF